MFQFLYIYIKKWKLILHCIVEICAYWVEPKPCQTTTLDIITRLLDNAAFVCFMWWEDFQNISLKCVG